MGGIGVLQAKYPSCHPTSSVNALKDTNSINASQQKSPTSSTFLYPPQNSSRKGHCPTMVLMHTQSTTTIQEQRPVIT